VAGRGKRRTRRRTSTVLRATAWRRLRSKRRHTRGLVERDVDRTCGQRREEGRHPFKYMWEYSL
jgi:hypothetical protein